MDQIARLSDKVLPSSTKTGSTKEDPEYQRRLKELKEKYGES